MYKTGQILHTSADFDNAIFFRLDVIVWQNGTILDYGGVIVSHNEHSVRIGDGNYLKATCAFRVR